MADLDLDGNDGVDLNEFVRVHDEDEEDRDADRVERDDYAHRQARPKVDEENPQIVLLAAQFSRLDRNNDGLLDAMELTSWIKPDGFMQADSEVVFLMEQLDENDDHKLTKGEILWPNAGEEQEAGSTFLSSQVRMSQHEVHARCPMF